MLSNHPNIEDILRSSSVPNDLKLKQITKPIVQDDFYIRFTTIQSWFLRCSFANKLKFLIQTFDILQRDDTLPIWCDIVKDNSIDKLMTYAETLKYHQFHYDKILMDSNRTCDAEALKTTMEDDIDWFKQCDKDLQEGIFLSLLSMGGGGVIKNICKHIKISYSDPGASKANIVIKDVSRVRASEDCLRSVMNSRTYTEPLNAKIPVDLIVMNKRKEWSKMMEKYNKAVTGNVKGDKKGGSGKKSKKTSKKTSKSSKKSKLKNKDKVGEIDYIQLLPIQIVKKIFSYLDNKTLKRAKDVNSYWTYAIDSLSKDRKARKGLDKAVKKLENTLAPDTQPRRMCKPEPSKPINLHEGTTSKWIQKKLDLKGLKHEETLVTLAIKEMADKYLIPLYEKLKSFPRKPEPDNDDNLYKTQSCIIYEAGFTEKRIIDTEPVSSEVIHIKMDQIIVNSPIISTLELAECEYDPTGE